MPMPILHSAWYRKQPGVYFQEKAATPDERSIADVLKSLYNARRAKDLDGILRLYTSDATLSVWKRNRTIGIPAYRDYLEKNLINLTATYFDQLIIRVKNEEEAIVSGVAYYRYMRESTGPGRIIFILKNMHGQWRIRQVEWQ